MCENARCLSSDVSTGRSSQRACELPGYRLPLPREQVRPRPPPGCAPRSESHTGLGVALGELLDCSAIVSVVCDFGVVDVASPGLSVFTCTPPFCLCSLREEEK